MEKNKAFCFIIILILSLYLYLCFFILPSNTFFTLDTSLRFIQVESILKNNFKGIHIPYKGKILDPEFKFFPIRPPWKSLSPHIYIKNEKSYSMHPIFFPFISSIFYKLFHFKGLYLIPILSSILSLILIYMFSKRFVPQYAHFSVIIMALCSPLFFYSLVFWEHTLSIFFTLLLFLLFYRFKDFSAKYFLLLGFLMGVNAWVRIESLILSLIFILTFYFLYKDHYKEIKIKLLYLSTAFLLGILPLTLYNYWLYGSILSEHNKDIIKEISKIHHPLSLINFIKDKIIIIYRLWFNGAVNRYSNISFFALILSISLIDLRRYKIILFLLSLFTLNSLYICLENLIECVTFITGIIPIIPYIIFIFFNLREKIKDRKINFLLLNCLLYLLFTSIIADSDGGNQWGPRYLLLILPVLIILSLYSLSELKNFTPSEKIFKGIFLILVFLGFLNQITGINLLYKEKKSMLTQLNALKSIKDEFVVSYSFGLSTENASLFHKKCFLWVDTENTLNNLLEKFKNHRINNFCFVGFEKFPLKKDKYSSLRWNFHNIIKKKGYKLIRKKSISSWYNYNEYRRD